MESFGSACSAVLCVLYLCVWVIFSGGGLVVLNCVFIFWGKKIFSLLFDVLKTSLLIVWAPFLLPLFGGFIFCLFVCFLQCCTSQSTLGAKWSLCVVLWATFFVMNQKVGGKGGRRVHGIVTKCLLYFSELWYQHCKAYCLFWMFILTLIFNISYIINVFSFQCNAFLRHS